MSAYWTLFAFFVLQNAFFWLKNVVFTMLIFNKLCILNACFPKKEVVSLRGLILLIWKKKEWYL